MIAVSSPAFSAMPFAQALETIASSFRAWEVVAEGRHDLREIEKDFLALTPSYDLEFSAHAPMSDINIGSLNPRMLEASVGEITACLEGCHRLGMGVCTVHPSFLTPIGMVCREKVIEVAKASLRRLDRLSRELGVKIGLENMPRSLFSMGTTPEALVQLAEGTEMGFCLDVGHANTMGLLPQFMDLKPRLVNLHVHDNQGKFDEHLPIGDGTVDFDLVVSKLADYGGRFVIESRGIADALVSRDRLSAML
ncbi:MAG: sugar phosphate isomerase/epimerase family protein [Methanomassiliicoccus sp.]|nr:sugar phosphate isomerase/epimerase family protein [Methanomassiliicoccus sp.]